MRIVRIIKNWDKPDIFHQTPVRKGIWENILFTEDQVEECDYAVILNYSTKNIRLKVPPKNIWCVLQEPPNEYFKSWHKARPVYSKVFTTDKTLKGERYVYDQPAIPWLVNKTYDELVGEKYPDKPRLLSCITSDKSFTQGHKDRIRFIKNLKHSLDFDIIATYEYYKKRMVLAKLKRLGFNKLVKDKWEGLAPYKYSLVIENFRGKNYWSEKLSDCFLSFTMPIYYGCPNITNYFPPDSLVTIDIHNPLTPTMVSDVLRSDLWNRNRKAIEKARELILTKYQFFPFITGYFKRFESEKKTASKEWVTIPKETKKNFIVSVKRIFKR